MIRRLFRFLLRLYYFHFSLGLSVGLLFSAFLLLAHPPLIFVVMKNRLPGPGDSLLALNLPIELALLIPGLACAAASWILGRELKSESVPGRGWVILASLLNIFVFLALSLLFAYAHAEGAQVMWAVQAVGAVGLIVFSRAGGPLWRRLPRA
jgi:hypothetical protein